MSSQELKQQVRTTLEQLDNILRLLHGDLAAMTAVLPVAANATVHLTQAVQLGEHLRQRIESAADKVGVALPAWSSRAEFDNIVASLIQAETAREAELPLRARLLGLADYIEAGELDYYAAFLPTKEDIKRRAVASLRVSVERRPLLKLPGPESSTQWLGWIWSVGAPERHRILDEIYSVLPDLVNFVEEIPPNRFQASLPPLEAETEPAVRPAAEVASASATSAPVEQSAAQRPDEGSAELIALAPPEVTAAAAEVATEETLPAAFAAELEPVKAERPHAEADPRAAPGIESPRDREPSSEAGSVEVAPAKPSDMIDTSGRDARPLAQEIQETPRPEAEAPTTPLAAPPEPKHPADDDVDVPTNLPPSLRSFASALADRWLKSDEAWEPAPWRHDRAAFVSKCQQALREAMPGEKFFHARVLAETLSRLNAPSCVSVRDVEAVMAIWAEPRSRMAGHDVQRNGWLRSSVDDVPTDGDTQAALRLRLFLEALRPARESPLFPPAIDRLVGGAQFENRALERLCSGLLKLAAQGGEPIDLLQEALSEAPREVAANIEDRLKQRREELHREVRQCYSAAGGQIKTTHSRRAWESFMEEVLPLLRMLYPEAQGGVDSWDVKDVRQQISMLPATLQCIAEKREVLHKDRSVAERTARRIADLAHAVNDERERLKAVSSSQPGLLNLRIPADDARALLGATAPLSLPEEDLCRRLLCRVLTKVPNQPAVNTDELCSPTPQDLDQQPSLRELLASEELGRDWPRLAALLLAPPGGKLLASDQILVDISEARGALDGLRRELDALAFGSLARNLVSICQEIDPLLARPSDLARLRLLRHFLREVRRRSQTVLEEALRRTYEQRVAALDDTPERQALKQAAEAGRYEILLQRELPTQQATSQRYAAWRPLAVHKHLNPRQVLRDMQQQADKQEALQQLLAAWETGFTGNVTFEDRTLRRRFCDWVFSVKHPTGQKLIKVGQNEQHGFFFLTSELLMWIQSAGLNPCFLPQLRQYNALAILTPPVARVGPDFVVQTLAAAARFTPQPLAVILVPHLPEEVRVQLLREAQKRQHAVAVIDDLDLCRLVQTSSSQGPGPLLILLEIIVEQQSLRMFLPFSREEGQHVKMEMFVGRRNEARELAQSMRYSRIFSGRKLGKSALLRFVQETYDNKPLPSKNTLRVLYVSAVGVSQEHDLVTRILEKMETQLHHADNVRSQSAGDRLEHSVQSYLKSRPTDSLLVVLDEADVFVEAQLRAYERERENCLSFRMSRRVEAAKDNRGLPRVRFVFVGYRATQTNHAAWANWGDVLRLSPLLPADATALVAGPLARLGIDADAQAYSIAFRCGFQPVVILRFGEVLLRRLEARHQDCGTFLNVTAEDVTAVFSEHDVQEEIRWVTWHNFEGHERSWVVFAALMLTFDKRPPWQGIGDAEEQILNQLLQLHPDTTWLDADAAATRSRIRGCLQEFVQRNLIIEERHGEERRYFMRFPHHLRTVLGTREDLEQSTKERIRSLRSANTSVQNNGMPGALLPAIEIERISMLLSEPARDQITPVVLIACHWPEALGDRSGGVPAHLGIEERLAVSASEIDWQHFSGGFARSRSVAILGASGDDVTAVRKHRRDDVPPPLLCGGADLLRWVLLKEQKSAELFEIFSVGRFDKSTVRWWFGRNRGLEFHSPNAIDRILARTSGVPLLLRLFDRLLCPADSGDYGPKESLTVGEERLHHAELRFDEQLGTLGSLLASGAPMFQLAPRERQLLRFIIHASQQMGSAMAGWNDLVEYFPMLSEDCRIEPLREEHDRVPLLLLEMLGLLPVDTRKPKFDPFARLIVVPVDDAMVRLVSLLPDGE